MKKATHALLRADLIFCGPSTFVYWTVHFLSYWTVHFKHGPSYFRIFGRPLSPCLTTHFVSRPSMFTSTRANVHIIRTVRAVHFLKSSNTANRCERVRWTLSLAWNSLSKTWEEKMLDIVRDFIVIDRWNSRWLNSSLHSN